MTFNLFKRLLPNGRAWAIIAEKRLRQFFEGLAAGASDPAVKEFDDVFNDLDPQLTTRLAQWENQFSLPNTGLTEQERRDRLQAAWSAVGGQSPRYIQDTLQAAGFDVYVHEWGVPSVEYPTGGSVNGLPAPVARDPFDFIADANNPVSFIGAGHDLAFCGGDDCFSNSQVASGPQGYLLVNKIAQSTSGFIGAGHDLAFCGGDSAASGATEVSTALTQYVIPADPTKYPYFLYIGAQTFPELATVPLSRRDEFEDLCLKICPAQQWLGILVNYT